MSDMRAYTREFMCELILLYKSVPCLWRAKNRHYLDRNIKDKSWEVIVDKLREVDPETDKGIAMKKINSLKISWRRENKKVKESIRSGASVDEVYAPKLWYFDLLRFIEDEESSWESFSNLDESEDGVVGDAGTLQDTGNNEIRDSSTPLSIISTSSASDPTTSRKVACKKRVYDHSTEVLGLYEERYSHQSEPQCRLDIVGKNWAEKMKLLPNDQRIFAEKLINDVLFEAVLGALNRHSSVTTRAPLQVPTQSSPTTAQSPQHEEGQ